jgi:hypothetical protein
VKGVAFLRVDQEPNTVYLDDPSQLPHRLETSNWQVVDRPGDRLAANAAFGNWHRSSGWDVRAWHRRECTSLFAAEIGH